jgi:hypothetical protein
MSINDPIEKTSPPLYDIKSPLDYSKLNPVGTTDVPEISSAQGAAIDAQKKLIQSLEERYANPNWFKVAAGFLKPQLGGFAASLGSASQALGEHTEAQRAIAPTIERMRTELAVGQLGYSQKVEQDRLMKEFDESGGKDLNKLYRAYRLSPDSPVGKSIEKRPEFEQSRRAEQGYKIDLQKEILKNPAIVIDDPAYKNIAVPPEKSAEFVKNVNAARLPGIDPAKWDAMGFEDKKDAIAKYNIDKMKENMTEGQKFAMDATQGHNVIDNLTELRQLAIDPKLAPIFSLFQNGDLFSQIRAFMNENPGKGSQAIEGAVASVMAKLKNVDEPTRAKADKLIKGVASLETDLRGSLNNPTDAASVLNAARSPSLANSQYGFVGILDQLALNANRDIGLAKLHYSLGKQGLNARDAAYSNELENYRLQTRELRKQYAQQYPSDQYPEWYGLKPVSKEEPKPAASASAPKATSAQPASAQPPAGSTWDQLQKWKQSQAQQP